MLPRLEPPHRSAVAYHDHRLAPLGAWVAIRESWYQVRPRTPVAPRRQARFTRKRCGRRCERASPYAGTNQGVRSEEHTSEFQSLMRISYAVFCLKEKTQTPKHNTIS